MRLLKMVCTIALGVCFYSNSIVYAVETEQFRNFHGLGEYEVQTLISTFSVDLTRYFSPLVYRCPDCDFAEQYPQHSEFLENIESLYADVFYYGSGSNGAALELVAGVTQLELDTFSKFEGEDDFKGRRRIRIVDEIPNGAKKIDCLHCEYEKALFSLFPGVIDLSKLPKKVELPESGQCFSSQTIGLSTVNVYQQIKSNIFVLDDRFYMSALAAKEVLVTLSFFKEMPGIISDAVRVFLLGFANSKLFQENKDLFLSVILRSLAKDSARGLREMTHVLPFLSAVKFGKGYKNYFCSDVRFEEISKNVYVYLNYFLKHMSVSHTYDQVFGKGDGRLSYGDVLPFIRPVLEELDSEKFSHMVDTFAQREAEHAYRNRGSLVMGMPLNRLWLYARQNMATIFNMESEELTELVYVKNPSTREVSIFAISTDSIDGEYDFSKTQYGIFVRKLEKFSESEMQNMFSLCSAEPCKPSVELSWKTLGKEHSQKVNFIKQERFDVFLGSSPDYKSQLKDGKYTGAIFTSVNRALHRWIIKENLAFFKDAGFVFQAEKKVSNFSDMLEQLITSGELDYMRQDGHSGQNQFGSVPLHAVVYEGKKDYDGIEYKIILATPDRNILSNEVLVSDFGNWMKQRDKNGGNTPLLYIDGRCNMLDTVADLYTASESENLVILATQGGVHPMKYYRKDANRALLQGILQQKSFSEIRSDMAVDENYVQGSSDKFIFPDEQDFKSRIVDRINFNISVEIE